MKIKIEKTPITFAITKTSGQSMQSFTEAVRDMKVGESFLFAEVTSNHRNALSILQYAFSRKFCCRKEGSSFRVARIG